MTDNPIAGSTFDAATPHDPFQAAKASALKAAETRMLRYLIAEIGKLLGELEERDRSPLGHHRHARREVS